MAEAAARPGAGLKRAGIVTAIAAAALLATGLAVRRPGAAPAAEAGADALPIVATVKPSREGEASTRTLPGRLQPLNSAAIFPRATGYVRRWVVDIGDRVRAGQLLAVIDSPEVDQQLAQARADYQSALANRELARTTARRWAGLLTRDAVSRQEADEKNGAAAASAALANAARANVERLVALQGFTRVLAPFAGVVTTRSTQIGALVVAGNAAAAPLFTIADVHRIRVFVRVPQAMSGGIQPGGEATLRLPELPDRDFAARVTRTAGALEAASGTMLVELQVPNADGALKPGAYAEVMFPADAGARALHLPATALLFGGEGVRVALVSRDGRVTLRPIRLGRDDGATVEVLSGLTGGERVIDNPPDAIGTGDRVRVEAAAGGGAAG